MLMPDIGMIAMPVGGTAPLSSTTAIAGAATSAIDSPAPQPLPGCRRDVGVALATTNINPRKRRDEPDVAHARGDHQGHRGECATARTVAILIARPMGNRPISAAPC